MCKRCGGNIFKASDLYGPYLYCIQCGWHEQKKGISLGEDGKPSHAHTGPRIKRKKRRGRKLLYIAGGK
jgi:hypothetical protein